MHIDTIRFPGSLIDRLEGLGAFFARTAFVVTHKSESLETLLGVLWFLPLSSLVIVVTNCPPQDLHPLAEGLRRANRENLLLVHQKDERIASFFREQGVSNLLGDDGLVIDGKGEGMYIGAACAALRGDRGCEWVVFYDADNFVPSALLEYSLAMARLFLAARLEGEARGQALFHNVRICWAAKPYLNRREGDTTQVLGRCSRVVSPLISAFFQATSGVNAAILTSNAGEQGLTLRTAKALRFSSGYSVETFQLLDLHAHGTSGGKSRVLLQQYQAQSAHFHQKGDEDHIRQMIAESVGCFALFANAIPRRFEQELLGVCAALAISPKQPRVYPPLEQLGFRDDPDFLQRFNPDHVGTRASELAASAVRRPGTPGLPSPQTGTSFC